MTFVGRKPRARHIETVASVSSLVLGVMLLGGCGASASTSSQGPTSLATHSLASNLTVLTVSVAPWRLPFAIAREAVVPLGAGGSGGSGRSGGSGTVIVGGGMLPNKSSSARTYQLALESGQVSPLPPLSVDVHDVAGGFYNGEPAIYGGGNSSEQSTVQQFHSGAWRIIEHMPTTRSDLSVGVVGTTTYVLGGYDGKGVPDQVLAQDAAGGGLRPAGQLVNGVRYAATAVLGSSIYLLGGEVSGSELNTVQRYDTLTGRTTVVAHLPVPLGHASAVALGGRILVIGGRVQPSKGTTAIWWFDPATSQFSRAAAALPTPVTDAALAIAPDGLTVWLLGGEDPNVRDGVIELRLS